MEVALKNPANTFGVLANAMPAIWRFEAVARSTHQQFQVTLSHKYLYGTPVMSSAMTSGAKINCRIFIYIFMYI